MKKISDKYTCEEHQRNFSYSCVSCDVCKDIVGLEDRITKLESIVDNLSSGLSVYKAAIDIFEKEWMDCQTRISHDG